jgi:hypothetical protein
MQSETSRQRAETCLRLALGAGDPEMIWQLIHTAADWLAVDADEAATPTLVPSVRPPQAV